MGFLAYSLLGVGAIACLIISIQDYQDRAISIWAFGLLIASGLGYQFQNPGHLDWSAQGINLAILGIILAILWLYLRITGRKQLMEKYLGWGDVLMLAGAAIWLDVPGFILLYGGGVLITLFIHFCASLLRSAGSQKGIPLAGALATMLILFFPAYHLFRFHIYSFLLL